MCIRDRSTAAQAADTITVVSWGGSYTTSQVEAYHKPWIAKTGNQINSEDYNGGLAEIRAQVEAGNVTWDLVDVELADAVRGCDEGILEPLPLDELPAGADGTPAKDDFIAGTLHECAVGEIVWSTVYAYDTTKVAAKPASIADFFDLEKIPGKRGLRKTCLLYTSDAADDLLCVDLGGRRIIKKKKENILDDHIMHTSRLYLSLV
eukprot:TRINITY_DN27850_c0_g1_i1.p1 TRINITY_DN27850_c0_g1~~TRINITY_DN27850_c0_g1_i1.p1  ORF type:complete len:206 (+),score=74.89 TRINITY_DN27850_c0_g1_i1:194-811(+)